MKKNTVIQVVVSIFLLVVAGRFGWTFVCQPGPSSVSPPPPPGLAGSPRVLGLPRPNSGTFTSEQAEAKKHLILSNSPSGPLKDWKNPDMGLAIHVGAEDRLTVYAVTPPFGDAIERRARVTVDDIHRLERSILQFGNPHGVLITSERPLQSSAVIHDLLKVLFIPSVQILYVGQP
jgi:hypothetical protein